MKREFDPGYDAQPFRLLCESYPGEEVYPRHDFRIEWGPVFHRGRLDGSATVLLIGQDPAANEAIVRRILVGVAGKRTQGLLRKLGLTRSYVMVNTFLYSVYGQQGGEKHRNDPKIAAYRHQWLDALLVGKNVQAVLSLGSLADSAWRQYLATPSGALLTVAYAKLLHPTYPDSAAGGDPTLLTQKTAELLANWNTGLAKVRAAVTRQDVAPDPEPYGDAFKADEIVDIPAFDIPAGLPAWMRREDGWSKRTGATTADKRATLTVTVPAADMTSADAVTASRVERRAAEGAAEPADALALAAEPVDPLPKGRLALEGRVVTMVRGERPIEAGVVYIQDGLIVAVRQAGAAAPAGFTAADGLDTGATLYPGLIELHNHLAYNILPMWKAPRRFGNRNEWSRRDPDYAAAVKGPMAILGTLPEVLPAIGRYVECKALMGGATTSQGIGLQSASGGQTKFFRGMIRNVEQTGEPKDLPEARTRIPDFSRGDIPDFLARADGPENHVLSVPPQRGHGRAGPAEVPGSAVAQRPVGDHPDVRGDPRGRAGGRRSEDPADARRRHGLVAPEQPRAVRGHREDHGRDGRGGADRAGRGLVALREQEPPGGAQGGAGGGRRGDSRRGASRHGDVGARADPGLGP